MTPHPPNVEAAAESADLLFYTDIRRTFRTSLIGYLYQACRTHRVVLLCEDLDPETDRLLEDRSLFPGLVQRVHVGQYDPVWESMLARHRRLSRLAGLLVRRWRPKTVFAAGINIFEHYLRRYAKQVCGSSTVGCLGLLLVQYPREVPLLLDLNAAETRLPSWLPRVLRLLAARTRRQFAQGIYYVLFPLLVGQRPFLGVNGIYRLDYTRMQGLDVSFVFTRHNQAMMLRAGVPPDRVRVVPHPLKPGKADAVWRGYGMNLGLPGPRPRVVTCFLDIEPSWGFSADRWRPIANEDLFASRIQVIETILRALPDWQVRIKPHPMSESSPLYETVESRIRALSPRVVWVPPTDPADRHIGQSGAIIGFPPASTAIFTAIMQNTGIPAMQVDINHELRGDAYLGMPGVVTVTSLQGLETSLDELRSGHWSEGAYLHDEGDFETFDALLSALC